MIVPQSVKVREGKKHVKAQFRVEVPPREHLHIPIKLDPVTDPEMSTLPSLLGSVPLLDLETCLKVTVSGFCFSSVTPSLVRAMILPQSVKGT